LNVKLYLHVQNAVYLYMQNATSPDSVASKLLLFYQQVAHACLQ